MIRVSTYKALTGRVPVPSCRVRNFLLSARGLCLGASDDLQLSFETHVQEETDWTEYLGTLPLSMSEDGQLVSSQTGGFIEEPRKQPADKLKDKSHGFTFRCENKWPMFKGGCRNIGGS